MKHLQPMSALSSMQISAERIGMSALREKQTFRTASIGHIELIPQSKTFLAANRYALTSCLCLQSVGHAGQGNAIVMGALRR
jgi:hypothetical protein